MKAAALLAVIAGLTGVAVLALQGPLPGDAALTLALQAAFGPTPAWAAWLTGAAKAPLLWGTLALAGVLAWQAGGVRDAAAVPLAYGFAFMADKALRALSFAPRPDPALVAVADPSASSGLPSTFGLVFGAIFGAALLGRSGTRAANFARMIAGGLIIAGAGARIVMGGHWPSQMLASTALGLLLALAACALLARIRPRQRG